MRILILLISIVSLNFALELGNSTQFIMPLNDNVAVYKNKTRKLHEKPLFKMNIDDRYLIIENVDEYVKIKNKNSEVGWVESRLIKKVKASSGFVFEKKLVEAYEISPLTSIIFGDNTWQDTIVMPDRSFSESIKTNVDRETIARMK